MLATSCYPAWVVPPVAGAPSLRALLDATLAVLPEQLRDHLGAGRAASYRLSASTQVVLPIAFAAFGPGRASRATGAF